MTTLVSALRQLDRQSVRTAAASPEKVRAKAAEIRRAWTPRERRRRAELGRYLLFERLLGGIKTSPTVRTRQAPVTPKPRTARL